MSEFSNETNRKRFFEAQTAFAAAAIELGNAWSHLDNRLDENQFTKDYPFIHSFDDVVSNIQTWVDTSQQ